MQKNKKTDQKIEKVVSSPIERAIENAAQKIFGKMIPEWMTPNMITMLGAAGGAAGIVFAFLAKKEYPLFNRNLFRYYHTSDLRRSGRICCKKEKYDIKQRSISGSAHRYLTYYISLDRFVLFKSDRHTFCDLSGSRVCADNIHFNE